MKLNKWMVGVFALGVVTACSESDLPGENDASKSSEDIASGYLALRINLPQQSSTRASADGSGTGDNVGYADGEAWEYKVDNATLVLYKGETAADAEYVSSHTLNRAFAPTSPSDNNISASSLEAVSVNVNYSEANDPTLWALVMLNVPDKMETPSKMANSETNKKTKFTDFLAKTTTESFVGTGTIFMTNAPLSTKPGGDKNPGDNPTIQTLVKLGKASKVIHPTLMEARENVAACIYVERAVAKLTANVTTNNVKMWDKNGKDDSDENKNRLTVKVEEASFGVMNINPTSYIVRRVTGFPASSESDGFAWDRASTNFKGTYSSPYYRMIGSEKMPKIYDPLHVDDQNLYRTYWCHDPNYNSENPLTGATNSEFKKVKEGDKQNAFYVKENTFNVKNMTYGNSTLAVFKIKFEVTDAEGEVAEALYVLNENRNSIYTSLKDVESHARNYLLGQENVKEALIKSTKTGAVGDNVDLGVFLKINYNEDSDENPIPDAEGVIAITSISLDKTVSGFSTYYDNTADAKFAANLPKDEMDKLIDRVNNHYTIEMYKDCESYYVIPVMHFGDKSTPWYAGEKNQSTTEESYKENSKYNANAYLGRYGMVRNNWYEVTVNSFTGIGSPVIPKFNADLANDNNEVKRYIGVETHILSWAKRNQTTDF